MGQYWYIFSVDNSEILSCIGKLGEFLWDKEADCLVDLLAVPLKRSPVHLSSAPKPVDDISSVEPLPTVANLEPTIQIQPYLAAVPNELILKIFQHFVLVWFRNDCGTLAGHLFSKRSPTSWVLGLARGSSA
jgi:hypothetical protein